MVSLYKNPRGESIFTGHENTAGINVAASQLGIGGNEGSVETLKKKIKELEQTIEKFKVLIIRTLVDNDSQPSQCCYYNPGLCL